MGVNAYEVEVDLKLTAVPTVAAKGPPLTPDIFDTDVVIGTFKRWSASAVECYVRQANCEGCYYSAFFKDRPYGCKMYLAVEQLLETLGEPSKNMLTKYG